MSNRKLWWALAAIVATIALIVWVNYRFQGPASDQPPAAGDSAGVVTSYDALSEGIELPEGYTLEAFEVAAETGATCEDSRDCQLPPEYAAMSNCPYVSLCQQNRCTVVCPARQDVTWNDAVELINTCRVARISPSDGRLVLIDLGDGRLLQTIEPSAGLALETGREAENSCGRIYMGDEF